MFRIISGGLGELVGPCVDDRTAIDILDAGHDALLELFLGRHSDVTQDRAGKLGEEALDKVEPGTMYGSEGELETASCSSGEPASGLLRYMGRMIVEDASDRGVGRVSSIKELGNSMNSRLRWRSLTNA
jgi:hypothetical protein